MNTLFIFLNIIGLSLLVNNKQFTDCQDLLTQYAERPDHLEIVSCDVHEDNAQIVNATTYKVSGEYAAEIEQFLVKKYGMGKLKFVCCGWEPENGQLGQHSSKQLTQLHPNYVLGINMYASWELGNEKEGSLHGEMDQTKFDFYIVVTIYDV
ncbi:MAG: DUF4952 domain-containing protein [Saprospiraceae bacterium]|nr:DUF4952 domain-containing protein [Saprospiraceae bacterium]